MPQHRLPTSPSVSSSRSSSFTRVYQRPESPTLPPENEGRSTRSYVDYHDDPTSPSHPTRSMPDIGTATIVHETSTFQETKSRTRSKSRPSASNSTTSSRTSRTKSTKLHKTPDHLATAIEISTTNAISSPAPAAGMYWSRTLTYDTMIWSKPRTVHPQYGPPPCRAHSCTVVEKDLGYGKKSHQLYFFGGGNGPDYFQDVYVLDAETLTWSKPDIDPQSRPSKRRAHTSCLWENKLVIIGGGDGARALDDVYMLDISKQGQLRWEKLETTGRCPPARGYHTSNLVKDKLVVFGGSDGHDCFEDIHVLDLKSAKWSQIELDKKIPRLAHTSTQVGSYVFVIGGHDGRRYSQEVLLFNLVTMSWESRKIYGVAPNPRGYHTTVLYDSRLYVLGGYDGKNVFDDVHMLELSACAYLPQITNFEIDV
ncbi:galactose oxidase [Rhizopus microsporus var. microsporus]|uniref:Galactose oxidase n=1 Tax=Rhizopus microsporus var. microsporus TaxID=86635 RepID=A0A1X0RAP1_RHIZD|nr:galactose oxidase [Rhizopus microsporus var. microsporus]